MKAALYARSAVRLDQASVNSCDAQLEALRGYAQREGMTIVKEYVDEGVSGLKESRPGLDNLMRDARSKLFNVVLVTDFTRISRSTPLQLGWSGQIRGVLEELGMLNIFFRSLAEPEADNE
jgi:DNA invertase Pin-like site-specific DNA recombinase